MPEDDTWECRKRALQYAEMAYNARTPEAAKLLSELAQDWVKRAMELEAPPLTGRFGKLA